MDEIRDKGKAILERLGLWQNKYLSHIKYLPEREQLIYIIAMDATYALTEALSALPPAESEGHAVEALRRIKERCDKVLNFSQHHRCDYLDTVISCRDRAVAALTPLPSQSEDSAPARVVPMRLFAGIDAKPSAIRQVLAVVGMKLEPNALDELQDSRPPQLDPYTEGYEDAAAGKPNKLVPGATYPHVDGQDEALETIKVIREHLSNVGRCRDSRDLDMRDSELRTISARLDQLSTALRARQLSTVSDERWTGRPCPKCKGTGIDDPEYDTRPCGACGGTGEEYATRPSPHGGDADIDQIWDIVHMAGGPFSEESARQQIAEILRTRLSEAEATISGLDKENENLHLACEERATERDEYKKLWENASKDAEAAEARPSPQGEDDEALDTIRTYIEGCPRKSITDKQARASALKALATLSAVVATAKTETAAIKYAIVQTAGGTVEGRPTNELNYLQRLRELVDTEARLAASAKDDAKMREALAVAGGYVREALDEWDSKYQRHPATEAKRKIIENDLAAVDAALKRKETE